MQLHQTPKLEHRISTHRSVRSVLTGAPQMPPRQTSVVKLSLHHGTKITSPPWINLTVPHQQGILFSKKNVNFFFPSETKRQETVIHGRTVEDRINFPVKKNKTQLDITSREKAHFEKLNGCCGYL